MVEAIAEIERYSKDHDRQSFSSNRPLQHLIVRNLEILGEAASRISPEFRQEHPQIAWRDMIDLRNRLIHIYFDLDLDIIWRTVELDLSELRVRLQQLL